MSRKKKFTSLKRLKDEIDKYFNSCFSYVTDKKTGEKLKHDNGEEIVVCIRPPTVSGLALHLGTTRQTLCDYEKDERFGEVITLAKRRVEQFAEESLYDKTSVTGSIFNLKVNFGWSEESATDSEDGGGVVEIPEVVDNSDE